MANIHPKLVNFNILNWSGILESEETVCQFLSEMGVGPDPKECPPCSSCNAVTIAQKDKSRKYGFTFMCRKCRTKTHPGKNTFLEGVRIPFREVFAVIVLFVLKFPLTSVYDHVCAYRRSIEAKATTMSTETVVSLYASLREVAEIIASHHCWPLGGPRKAILPFVTTKKYRTGRQAQPESYSVLGLFCKEDKDGIFLMMDGQKPKDLLPLIKGYCHPDASVGHSSESKQQYHFDLDYDWVDTKETRKSENHQTSKAHMALDIYRRVRLQPLEDNGSRIDRFLRDIAAVYPGWKKEGLRLRNIETPPKSDKELTPSCKVPKFKSNKVSKLQSSVDSENLTPSAKAPELKSSVEPENLTPSCKFPNLESSVYSEDLTSSCKVPKLESSVDSEDLTPICKVQKLESSVDSKDLTPSCKVPKLASSVNSEDLTPSCKVPKLEPSVGSKDLTPNCKFPKFEYVSDSDNEDLSFDDDKYDYLEYALQ
ncbi:uncharacterized protein LOC129229911 [Uloborus diversus]|uniref:uncharacterized protein LOC129229911 n=1 Tax=Uloborus diversus TaxID=327109 RepID=UPI00240A8721|nr:uncharacterized protein LOC129229911 [Uloborus diversus]